MQDTSEDWVLNLSGGDRLYSVLEFKLLGLQATA